MFGEISDIFFHIAIEERVKLFFSLSSPLKIMYILNAETQKELFHRVLKKSVYPDPIKEYKFHKKRKWRIDFCWPQYMLAFEIEGGIFVQGRHTRGKGFLGDIYKYNEIELQGFTLLRSPPDQLLSYGMTLIDRFFQNKIIFST